MFSWGDVSWSGFVKGLAHMHENLSFNNSTHVKARYVKSHHLRDKGRSKYSRDFLAGQSNTQWALGSMENIVSKNKVESIWGRYLTPASDLHTCAYHMYVHTHKCAHTHKHVVIHITHPKIQEFFYAMLEAKSPEVMWQQGHVFSESYMKGLFLPTSEAEDWAALTPRALGINGAEVNLLSLPCLTCSIQQPALRPVWNLPLLTKSEQDLLPVDSEGFPLASTVDSPSAGFLCDSSWKVRGTAMKTLRTNQDRRVGNGISWHFRLLLILKK